MSSLLTTHFFYWVVKAWVKYSCVFRFKPGGKDDISPGFFVFRGKSDGIIERRNKN